MVDVVVIGVGSNLYEREPIFRRIFGVVPPLYAMSSPYVCAEVAHL